jgi:signal transduction histidine kinase/ligand-binding sensor domain-containing protein
LSPAQDHGFFNQVWLEQGLSQSSISSIIQDKKGFMWFGTQDGLNRYDGRLIDHYNFRPFHPNTLSGDNIISSCTDNNNHLWIVSGGGLDKMDLNTFKVTRLKESVKPGEKPATLQRAWYKQNTLFLYSSKGLVKVKLGAGNEYTLEPFHFEKESGEFRTAVFSLNDDEKNNLYAATNRGIYRIDNAANSGSPLFGNAEINTPQECFTVFCKNGKICYTIGDKFCSHDPEAKVTYTISLGASPYFINCALIDKQDNIWLGTNGKGLYRISNSAGDSLYIDKRFFKNQNHRFGLKSDDISFLYQNPGSDDDIVWIGSADAGAFNYSYSKNSFSLPSSILDNNATNFFAITKDKDGVIWAGVNYNLCKIDRKNKSYSYIDISPLLNKMPRRWIEGICCDNDNTIWIGFGNSLYKIDRRTNQPVTVVDALVPGKRNHVSKLVELNKDELVLGTWQGLIIFNKKTNKTKHITDADIKGVREKLEQVSSIYIDKEKNFWLGTTKGLFCIGAQGKPNFYFQNDVKDTNSLLSNRVMDVNALESGEIIVATTKGLSILKNRSSNSGFINYYSVKGLSNNFIYGLLRDEKGNIWMSTNYGISVFEPKKNSFKSYSATDGVCINEFNSSGYFRATDGELIFGGIGGLACIYPAKQIINKDAPDIFLRSLKVERIPMDSTLTVESPLYLSHDKNRLRFDFSVPDFSGPENISLIYRIKNSTLWTEVSKDPVPSILFENLAPGRYNLEVKARNKEGIESASFVYPFIISPPFWFTWWFFLLGAAVIVLCSWMIYRIRLRVKIAHIKELEEIRKEENEKVRKAAALDLHDEFGNGLTRISMLVEMARIKLPKENTEANQLLDVITQNSSRLYQGTKDFIWSINPGNDNLYEIIIRIKDFGDELFYGTGCSFEVVGLSDDFKNIRQLPGSGRNIAMLFKEALSNILKHAKATKVRLSLQEEGENVVIRLKDNGKGFEIKNKKNSFGLSNMNQRASRIGGALQVKSEDGFGTEIILSLSKKPEFELSDNRN